MKRLDYEAPTMEEIVVEMEECFAASAGSDVNNVGSKLQTEGHDKGADITIGTDETTGNYWVTE